MTPKSYLQTQMLLVEIGKALSQVDLKGFIAQIDTAKTEVAKINPELFERTNANLLAVQNMAIAAVPLQEAFKETLSLLTKTSGYEMMKSALKEVPPPDSL